jgi:hypothetical protein
MCTFAIERKKKKLIATTTTRKRRTVSPFTKAWNQAKTLDNVEKLQLITLLAESVKPAMAAPMLDVPVEEKFDDMDKEFYAPEEAYDLVMKDIKEIYGQ